MADNHKALLESLITNQGPFNGSYETHWPFNAEDTPRRAGRLTDSRANFRVNHFILRNVRSSRDFYAGVTNFLYDILSRLGHNLWDI